jgi:hypothetical protein
MAKRDPNTHITVEWSLYQSILIEIHLKRKSPADPPAPTSQLRPPSFPELDHIDMLDAVGLRHRLPKREPDQLIGGLAIGGSWHFFYSRPDPDHDEESVGGWTCEAGLCRCEHRLASTSISSMFWTAHIIHGSRLATTITRSVLFVGG